MTKFAIITDTHFGARADSIVFQNFFKKFYSKIFFPVLDKIGVEGIIHCGDIFDRRKQITFTTASLFREQFLQPVQERNLPVYALLGNHDIYYRNTLDLSGVKELYSGQKNFNIIDKPMDIEIAGQSYSFLPWICLDNEADTYRHIRDTKSKFAFAHLELNGFSMGEHDMPVQNGMDRKLFSKYDMVYTGHYHAPQMKDNILYLGSPYEMTWADYQCSRGFYIIDMEEGKIKQRIKTPISLFQKFVYDDSENPENVELMIKELAKKPADLRGSYVKVLWKKRTNAVLADKFQEAINQCEPADYQGIESDQVEFEENLYQEGSEDEFEMDTLTLIRDTIENSQDISNKKEVTEIMCDLYNEANNVEQL